MNQRRVNREGTLRETVPGLPRGKPRHGGENTRREGGRREAWATRRQPNRYETYREGSRRSRASLGRARQQAKKEVSLYG